jgi:hypothetical protein
MDTTLFKPGNKIHSLAWQAICLITSIVSYILIIENRSPNFLRPLSVSLRTSFGVVILVTTLVMYLAYRIPGKIGQLIGMAITLALFAMPLAGLWVSGQTQSIVISGLIPVSDATNYYIDALRILNGMDISSFSAMRPFFPGFLSFLLGITSHNLMSALGILTALMGIAAYIASREIQRTHGTEPAVIFLMFMFLYFRLHSGTTLSESLGVTVSLLGIALLWQGKEMNKQWIVLFGIFMATFALNIRPGAMFVLPAFLLWGGWYFRGHKKFSIRFLVIGTLAIASVFYLNNLMISILAGPNNAAFANFSWAFYGLASGGNSWTHIFQAHPEVFLLNSQEQNRAIYKLAFELIIQDPSLLVKGALKYWGMFFSSTWYNAYSFIAGESFVINEIARWGIYFFCGLGFLKWIKDHEDKFASLVGLAALGVLASVPFVPPTDAYRVRLYAATIPIFGLLPAMGVAYLRDKLNFRIFPKTMSEMQTTNWAIQFCILLAAALLIAPILIKINSHPPEIANVSCPSEMDRITINYDPGTFVNVTRENLVFLDWMPNFHNSNFRRNAHSLADENLIQAMTSINPPSTLFYALDFQTNTEVLVIIKTDILPRPGRILSICGKWDGDSNVENYRIFHASFMAGK